MYYRKDDQPVIPKAQCKVRRLYRIDSRNLGPVAVWNGRSFISLRRKYSGLWIDGENHRDDGLELCGHVNPFEELLEELPESIALEHWPQNVPLFQWLKEMTIKYGGPPGWAPEELLNPPPDEEEEYDE